jgi:hypothetical protein
MFAGRFSILLFGTAGGAHERKAINQNKVPRGTVHHGKD